MPGVIILEALAQTGAVALLTCEEHKGKLAYFGAMDKVKFKRQVVPGDVLELQVEITKLKGDFGVGKAVAYVEEQVAVEAILTFALGEK
jgi:3-hydroxyacyl-[acyl-carrier-protein] dehydratase